MKTYNCLSKPVKINNATREVSKEFHKEFAKDLREIIVDHFTKDELETLVFDDDAPNFDQEIVDVV